jgi:hypothetical protein
MEQPLAGGRDRLPRLIRATGFNQGAGERHRRAMSAIGGDGLAVSDRVGAIDLPGGGDRVRPMVSDRQAEQP